jgi:hypothetical protein
MNARPSLEMNRKPIYWMGGAKGGVGKSMLTMAAIDYLTSRGDKVLLVECDMDNPDVWKAYHEEVDRTELINLREADGWIHLVNVSQEHSEHTVVVNTAAQNSEGVTMFGATLDSSLDELARPLVTLWVINRQRDSVELLRSFLGAVPRAVVHVVRNGYWGDERKFELYNDSNVRRDLVEGRGGMSVTFPELADRVADDLYVQRLSIASASKKLPLGNRAELARWRREAHRVLAGVMA